MDRETLEQLFEPFFTTKELGKGTGLRLATVYGVVKQNNGFINVYSELGKGTTFRVYLPRYAAQAVETEREAAAKTAINRGETVLLVEDEPSLQVMAKRMLEKLEYRVLAASTPNEAIGLAEKHAGEIKLLITDVVMPEMNGRDLAERMQSLYPGMKILFMSGYTADVVVNRGVLVRGELHPEAILHAGTCRQSAGGAGLENRLNRHVGNGKRRTWGSYPPLALLRTGLRQQFVNTNCVRAIYEAEILI